MGYVLGGGYSPGYKPARPTDKFKPGYHPTARDGRAARNPRRSGIERKRHRTRVPSSDEAVFPRGLEVVVLLGLVCAALQVVVLRAGMRWARFDLVGAPLPGCRSSGWCEQYLPFNIEYGLWAYAVQGTDGQGYCAGDCRPNADGTYPTKDRVNSDERDTCTLVMSAADQACIEYYGERCNPKKNTKNGYCREVEKTTIYAQNCTLAALVLAVIAGLVCLFECFLRHYGPICSCRSCSDETGSPGVLVACSTLLWIGGAVSVGGTVRYEDEMGERDKDVISDKLATCLEGCQLARAAGIITIVGGLVATLLQAFCAKSGDSGEQQTVSAPPMNEKREPAAPAAEAEEARLATQAEEEIPAPVERPGVTRKLAWYLFGEEEPAVESEGVVVEAEAMREREELEPES